MGFRFLLPRIKPPPARRRRHSVAFISFVVALWIQNPHYLCVAFCGSKHVCSSWNDGRSGASNWICVSRSFTFRTTASLAVARIEWQHSSRRINDVRSMAAHFIRNLSRICCERRNVLRFPFLIHLFSSSSGCVAVIDVEELEVFGMWLKVTPPMFESCVLILLVCRTITKRVQMAAKWLRI